MNPSMTPTTHQLSFHPSAEGCLPRCIGGGGSSNQPVFNERKNSNINMFDFDEDLIAKALSHMSIGERSKVFESIHGVEALKDEDDPEHILALQHQMKQEIYRMVADPHGQPQLEGLKLALKANTEYVLQPKQLLRFLRSDLYNPVKAARRLARWLDWKLAVWGVGKLTRDIVFDDLSKEEQELYKLGYAQRLPTRDRAGREVWVYIQMNQKNPENLDLYARYMFYSCTPVEESEKSGIAIIFMYLEGFRWDMFNPKEIKIYKRVAEDLPIKLVSIHQCYIDNKSPELANTLKYFLTLMDDDIRARVKIHQGSYTEICYALMTFGIPHSTIPLTHDGRRKTKFHHETIQMRQTRDEYRAGGTSVALIELPLNSDVLLGKGLPIQSHPGNIQLQAIVDEHVDKYYAMTKNKDKTNLAADIVLMVKQASGRFLSKESGVWMEVDDGIAREKVSRLFCYRRKHVKKVESASLVSVQSKLFQTGEGDSKRFKSLGSN